MLPECFIDMGFICFDIRSGVARRLRIDKAEPLLAKKVFVVRQRVTFMGPRLVACI